MVEHFITSNFIAEVQKTHLFRKLIIAELLITLKQTTAELQT